MSMSQKVGHVLLLWLPDSPRDCWVFSPFSFLFLLSGVTTFTLVDSLGCISDGYSSVFPYSGSNLFSSWRSPLLKYQSLKLCCSWLTHAEPAYGVTYPQLLLRHKEAYSHLWLTAVPEESKQDAGAQSSQGSCDIKGKLFHSSKFVSENPRKALNFTVS